MLPGLGGCVTNLSWGLCSRSNFYKMIKQTARPKLDMYKINGEYMNLNHFLTYIFVVHTPVGQKW